MKTLTKNLSVLVLIGGLAAVLATAAAPARAALPTLSDYDAEQLGITFAGIVTDAAPPSVDRGQAEAIARSATGMARAADDARRGLYSSGGVVGRSVWVVSWVGGEHRGPSGPAIEPRPSMLVQFTGAVIDDRTGEMITWFQTGSQR